MGHRVIVVGAGIIGVSAALALAEAGHQVTLYEADVPGGRGAASFGNGGWISPASIIPMSYPGLWRDVPRLLSDPSSPLTLDWRAIPQLAPWLVRFLWSGATQARVRATAQKLAWLIHDAPARHLAQAQGAGLGHLIEQKGLLYAYPDQAAFARETFAWQLRRDNGIAFEVWQEADLRARLPDLGPTYRFGSFVPQGAHCRDTGAYVAGLAARCEQLGVQIRRTPVHALLHSPAPRVIFANGQTEACDYLVLAAGIGTKALLKTMGVSVPLQSERGYHVTLPQADVDLAMPVMPSSGKMANTPTDMGLRLSGQVELAAIDKPPTWARAEVLRRHASETYPALALSAQHPLQVWMGHRPSTPDGLPVIGAMSCQPRVIAAFGHGHIGLCAAPKTAELVVQAIAGTETPEAQALSPRRFGA